MTDFAAAITMSSIVLIKLVVAMICGGAIGYERERYDHPAGFRTHVLVCVGAAVYMMVSMAVGGDRFDQGRIAAQVASGIGFLGAGTIIKQGSIVRGLTTAASLWAAAGIGLAAGYSFTTMGIALLGTFVVLVALYGLKTVEHRFQQRRTYSLYVTLPEPRQEAELVRTILAEYAVEVVDVSFPLDTEEPGEVCFQGGIANRDNLEAALTAISAHKQVQRVRWEYQ